MVVFAIERDQFRVEVRADFAADVFQLLNSFIRQHVPTVFRDKDQMRVQLEDAVAAGS